MEGEQGVGGASLYRYRKSGGYWLTLLGKYLVNPDTRTLHMVDFIQQIPIWQLWLVAAFILFALEVLTPGFILACFGVGALVAIPVAALGLSWLIQIIAFCVGSLLALWLLQPLMCRWFQSHDTKTGMDALIGRRVFVSEEILPGDAGGRVAVDGDSWRAVAHGTTESIPAGTEVRIRGYQSLVLEVEPLMPHH